MGHVCVITVTYGKRWSLLRRVLLDGLACQTHQISQVFIVDNGAETDLKTSLQELVLPFQVEVIGLGHNTGSASGFKSGMEAALRTDCNFLWLLDDDNCPEPDALQKLFETRTAQGNNPLHAFASFRTDREKYVRALIGKDKLDPIQHDSFHGFHLGDLLRLARKRIRKPTPLPPMPSGAVCQIGYAIYGGLLLGVDLVRKIGLPDESYFLYMDDREFTVRIPLAGGAIFLVSESRVVDLETSWNIKKGVKALPMMDTEMPPDKVYYTNRNQVAFDRKYVIRSVPIYLINAAIFFLLALARGLLQNRSLFPTLARFRLLLAAFWDGWTGRMGPKAS